MVVLSLIYQALIIILLLTFSFGPAFFALINTGIKHGYKPGSLLAIGIVLSDFMLCLAVSLVVHLGAINLLRSEKAQTFSAIIGGVILIAFGTFYFRKYTPKPEMVIEVNAREPHPFLLILKGFVINLFNPTVWFLWLGNVTAIGKTFDYSFIKMTVFFSIVLGATLAVELTKVYLAVKIKHFLTPRLMTIVNYITGSALIIFGLVLIYNHFFNVE
ncbi:MAG: lysine exporter protein (lyse/ygga) [Bacteroidota bacterium]|jgi:threonine/homoserine/homoserine lactone efflux protein|nr:lysine exporter protein (lyse/ygga) [Bacteroidota bacterium]